MSRPFSNVSLPSGLPAWMTGSALTAPFLEVASISDVALSGWLAGSNLVRGVGAIGHTLIAPLRQFGASLPWLKQVLSVCHGLLLMLTLLCCTFASTEIIGGTVVLASGVLLLRILLYPVTLRLNMVDVLVGLFFGTAVLATAFSSYVHTSLIGLFKFSIFFLGYANFRALAAETLRWWWGLLVLLVLLGAAESVIGLYQYINHVQPLATWQDTSVNPEDQLTRIFGTLQPSNPNLLAGFLIPALASGTGLALIQLSQKRWLQTGAFAGLSGLMFVALALTGSRGGYLAILVMSLMMFMLVGHLLWHQPELKERYRLKALWLLVLIGSALAAILAVGLISPIRNRVFSIFAMREDSSNSYRMNVWASTIRMIKDNWLVGIGPGNDTFKQVYGLYMTPGYNALSAYSIFLEIWAEQGILGLLLFMLMLSAAKMRMVIGIYARIPLTDKLTLGLLYVAIIGSVVYGLFDTIWYRPSVNLLFWLLVAGFAVTSENALQSAQAEEPV